MNGPIFPTPLHLFLSFNVGEILFPARRQVNIVPMKYCPPYCSKEKCYNLLSSRHFAWLEAVYQFWIDLYSFIVHPKDYTEAVTTTQQSTLCIKFPPSRHVNPVVIAFMLLLKTVFQEGSMFSDWERPTNYTQFMVRMGQTEYWRLAEGAVFRKDTWKWGWPAGKARDHQRLIFGILSLVQT